MMGIPYSGRIPEFNESNRNNVPEDPNVIQERLLREEQDQAYQDSLLVLLSFYSVQRKFDLQYLQSHEGADACQLRCLGLKMLILLEFCSTFNSFQHYCFLKCLDCTEAFVIRFICSTSRLCPRPLPVLLDYINSQGNCNDSTGRNAMRYLRLNIGNVGTQASKWKNLA